jgi:class 3 adenylate cyclase/tetratricopeptide (TPR) repeat protein
MTFDEVLSQVQDLLQREKRVSYRGLKRRFALDDEYLGDLKEELIGAKRLATDEDGRFLVWTGGMTVPSNQVPVPSPSSSPPPPQSLDARPQTLVSRPDAGERRQLTVMFIDLVGSTTLSHQLDPEELRDVIQAYRETCAAAISRFGGYLAKYIGDGLLVYFGYPQAHEDDAQRAVRTGLEIVAALPELNTRLHATLVARDGKPLQVRIGIHTGLVVAGEMGVGDQLEPLAIVGETPNIAARIQGLAEPNTVIISATTQRLIEGQFESQPFGSHLVKGIDTPIAVYHVQSERQRTSPLAGRTLTPLVGREQEVGLLLNRWEQAKEGRGQVVLLSGEPGIGKSRLAYTLREHVTREGSLLFEARCSPYHQHSAFYPLIDVMQRTLLLTRYDTDSEKVAVLERALALYNTQESLPLFTALLSLPPPSHYPALTLTPQKQKERTLQALVQLFVAQAERQATVSVWEDLHWADPSSLEFLSLLLEQIPITKLLLVLTFRPEFTPGWKPRSHISQLVLNCLGKKQIEAMIEKLATDQVLSAEVIEQIRLKTDGVPLFVEEITKSVIESVTSVGAQHAAPLHFAIPATLQEALLARLDRLSEARQVAQLGATLGREFSYELLHAVFPISETEVQTALTKLVEAEILYQRGVGEHARYFFKHALIQDTAYQSLLKSTRQQYHTKIAQVLEGRFPETVATQPELVAHHYTEADLKEQAIPYWQQAGERANQRSAYVEAVAHLTKGLELLQTLPDTPERIQQELTLQLALYDALTTVKGVMAPEVEKTILRAQELCQQLGETPQMFPMLWRLCVVYANRGEQHTALELAEQMMRLAQSVQDPYLLSVAHWMLGATLGLLGELTSARTHLEQAVARYDPQQHPPSTLITTDLRVNCLSHAAWALWRLGYPDQALKKSQEVVALAEGLSHPQSLAYALAYAAAGVHLLRREEHLARERAEEVMALSTEQGFPFWLAVGMGVRGWALAEQGQVEEGIAQMRQSRTPFLALLAPYVLAEAYGKVGQIEEGLTVLAKELALVDKTGTRVSEAELYRGKGELLLMQEDSRLRAGGHREKTEEAEECFLKAVEIAKRQQAKSLELRAVMSLARLWQQQDKQDEAHQMLAEIYGWFTEGFDTKDLQEAKMLLDELSEGSQ